MMFMIQEIRTLQMFVHIFLDFGLVLSVLFADTLSINEDETEMIKDHS